MKRIIFFLLIVSPVLVFAESDASTVASRYCPDPAKDFFKGSIYYENSKPWIEVKVDQEFEAKMVRERTMTAPLPLTPVYDLVVRVKPEFNYYCIPGWIDGALVTAEKLPPFLHVTAALVVGTKDEVVVDPVVFSRTNEQDAQGRFVYERKMKGWMNGVASSDKLTRLVGEIDKARWLSAQGINISAANIIVTIPKIDGDTEKIKSPVPFSNCVPIWGGGKHKIVGGRATPTLLASELVNHYENVRKNGFAVFEPYASYQSDFSYEVDLVLRQPKGEYLDLVGALKENKQRFITVSLHNKILGELFENSSCKNGLFLQVVQGYLTSLGVDGISMLGTGLLTRGALVEYSASVPVYVHEFSHLFAGINDEYVYRKKFFSQGIPLRNCSLKPSIDFSYQGKMYGGTRYEGCSYSFIEDGKGAVQTKFYRSTPSSMMKTIGHSFNTASCGYILAAIKGGDAKSYFPECAAMKGIITDGVAAQGAFSSMFAWVGNIFSSSSSFTAQVGSAAQNNSQSQYLIAESFDSNDPWGQIIEIVPDAQAVPAYTTSNVLPSSANITDISDDSIFDTVSVDLKVNGRDGSIEVEKRDRIVLSWISEGATHCRGVWSKNDIKLSGTAAGRITRPVTIKIACINADGERADDAVRVDVVE